MRNLPTSNSVPDREERERGDARLVGRVEPGQGEADCADDHDDGAVLGREDATDVEQVGDDWTSPAAPCCGTAPVGTYWVFCGAANCCCGLYVPGADGAEFGGM